MARSERRTLTLWIAAAIAGLAGPALADTVDLACTPRQADILALNQYVSIDTAASTASAWMEGHPRTEATPVPVTITDTQALFQSGGESFKLDRQGGGLDVVTLSSQMRRSYACKRLAEKPKTLF